MKDECLLPFQVTTAHYMSKWISGENMMKFIKHYYPPPLWDCFCLISMLCLPIKSSWWTHNFLWCRKFTQWVFMSWFYVNEQCYFLLITLLKLPIFLAQCLVICSALSKQIKQSVWSCVALVFESKTFVLWKNDLIKAFIMSSLYEYTYPYLSPFHAVEPAKINTTPNKCIS